MRLISVVVLIITLPCSVFAGLENLDEVISRKSRQASATWGITYLEDAGNNYIWQPETLCYRDVITGKEVWRLSGSNNTSNAQQDISWPTISADGKYITWKAERETGAHASTYYATYGLWFIAKLDGTILRPLVNGPARSAVRYNYFSWSPVEPDVFYSPGLDPIPNELNLDEHSLFKTTVTDTGESYASYITGLATLDGDVYGTKKGFSSDGTQMVFKGLTGGMYKLIPVTILPVGSKGILDDGYTLDRGWDDYWGQLDAFDGTYHDQFLTGTGSDIWFHILPEGTPTPSSWMRMKLTGTAADGGPDVVQDRTAPYDWGGELDYVNTVVTNGVSEGDCDYPNRDPNACDNDAATDSPNYFSHYTVDRWGKYVIYSNTGGASVGVGIWDMDVRQHEVEQFTGTSGAQHHDWHAWSNWSASSSNADYPNQKILTQDYTDSTSQEVLASAHIAESQPNYERLARPTQSPDGTKINWHSTFLNTDLSNGVDLFYVVAYYPYPAEVKTLTATGGTVTLEAHWNLAGTTRGYTDRGWPDESTDDPPPPREIESFRLWRSTDKSTWTPVKTFTHDIWDVYDFSDGTWNSGAEADNTWTTTDMPGDGTWYYAVTSIEHSKLESHALSNIFSITVSGGTGTGSQDTAYPAAPGADSDFVTAYNSDIHKCYNIYAEDGSTPTISQTNLIASDSRATKSFIDVFGDTGGTTQYTVTAIDTQGNEGSTLAVESSHVENGRYTITWDDVEASISTTITGVTITGVTIQ